MLDREWCEAIRIAKNEGKYFQFKYAAISFVRNFSHKDIMRFKAANPKRIVLGWYEDYFKRNCCIM